MISLGGISIHAPVKGATLAVEEFDGVRQDFNPRSREGSDEWIVEKNVKLRDFNPRSREGSDQYWYEKTQYIPYFNPRSREGSDGV